jgi:hypothetical protein
MADEGSVQLQIQNQINEAVKARSTLLNTQTKILSSQLDLVVKMRNALKGEGLKEAQKAIDDVTTSLDANVIASEKAAEGSRDLGTAAAETGKKMEKAKKPLITGKKVFGAFADAMSAGLSTMTNVGSAILNIAGAIGELGITILSTPFKIFDAFIETAQTLPRNTAIADALEEIRDIFGDIATGPGKAVASQLSTISKSARDLAGTGLSVTRVFGFGAEGIAGALKAVNELAQGTGESFTRLKGVFQESGLQLTMMQKGLGVTAENMGQLMNIAELRGKDVGRAIEEFSKITLQTAEEFGMGVKTMAKGMAELNIDVSTFGHLGPKAFAPMVVYAKKLGIEVKQLAGTMKKFSGFSDTAKAASELAQGFGMNIDTMKLMAAQNPAKKIDMLRKSFFNAGNDISKMSYQQRQYLEQTTGLEGTALEAAFSLEKQGLSYENIEKQAKKAGKQQITQKKVMQDLGKQIKKLNHLMNVEKYAGFFDAFIKGFGVGLMKAGGMRGALKDIQKALLKVHKAGREVAYMFVKYFPGVKTMLSAISELFDPAKIKNFTDGIKGAFEKLFKSENGWSTFFTNIEKVFEEQAGPGGSILTKLKTGFKKFAGFIMKGVALTIETAATKLFDTVLPAIQGFLDKLTTAIKKEAGKGADGMNIFEILFNMGGGGAAKASAGSFLEPVIAALGNAWTSLKPQLEKIWKTLWPIIKPMLKDVATVAGAAFMSGFLSSITSSMITIGGPLLATGFGKMLKGSGFMKGMGTRMAGMVKGLGKFLPKITAALKAIPFLGTIVAAAFGLYDAATFGGDSQDKRLSKLGVHRGVVFAESMLSAMTFGVSDYITGGGMDKLREIEKTINGAVKSTAVRLNNAVIKEAGANEKLMQTWYKEALKKGDKQGAIGLYAQMQLQKAIASDKDGFSKMSGDVQQTYRTHFLASAKLAAGRNINKIEKAMLAAEDDDKAKKSITKMAAAHKMIGIIDSIADLEKKIVKSTKKLMAIDIVKLQMDIDFSMQTLMSALIGISKVIDADELLRTSKIIGPTFDAFGAAIDVMLKPIASLGDKFFQMKSGLANIGKSTTEAAKIMRKAPFTRLTKELPHMEAAILGIDKVVSSVNTAGGKLTNENISKMQPVLDAIKGFKGGKIEVSHNLPNTKIELTVSIDSKKLAEALVAIDLGKSPASTSPNDRTYLSTQKGQTKLPGSA